MFKTFLLFVFILTSTYAYGQRESILNQPIIEGQSIAGINLGDSETDVFKVLGSPYQIHSAIEGPSHQKGVKALIYVLSKNNMLFIFTRYSKIEVIQLLWSGQGPSEYKGRTSRGIGIGDTIEDLKKQYGECEMSKGFCWYKNMGISVTGDKVILFIQITQSGREIPEYIKPNL